MGRFGAVLLVGHGGIARDTPRELVVELKRLARQRESRGDARMSAEEIALDRRIRDWPRTPTSDPYQAGLESIAKALAPSVAPLRLAVAYNEFCAPSADDAIDELVMAGAGSIVVVTTMLTPGGSHAEIDLPGLVDEARARHPRVAIHYAWPFPPDEIAEFLARHIRGFAPAAD